MFIKYSVISTLITIILQFHWYWYWLPNKWTVSGSENENSAFICSQINPFCRGCAEALGSDWRWQLWLCLLLWFSAAAALDKSGRDDGGPVTTQAPESRRQRHANSMAPLLIIQSQVYWNGKENYAHREECDRTRSVKPGHRCHNPRQSECWETGLQGIKKDNRITQSRKSLQNIHQCYRMEIRKWPRGDFKGLKLITHRKGGMRVINQSKTE